MEHMQELTCLWKAATFALSTATGRIVREAKVASEPGDLIAWFRSLGLKVIRIGLEAGPLSQWLYAAMKKAGLSVELLETRHVRDAFKAMPVKTDRKDARGIAQLMRLGWFRPVHCKSLAAQEVRAVLTARKLVQSKLYDVEMSLRGILRGFGLEGWQRRRSEALSVGSESWSPDTRRCRLLLPRFFRYTACSRGSSGLSKNACGQLRVPTRGSGC